MTVTPPEPDYRAALGDGLSGLARGHVLADGDPAELIAQTFALTDGLLATLIAKDPPTEPLACAKGCAACCHVRVSVTAPEALLIVRHLRPTEADWAERLRPHVADLHELVGDDYFLTPIPCPFLIDSACAVYPVRPLMCRRANSIDAAQCGRAIYRAVPGEITGYRHQAELYRIAAQALTEGIAKAGREAATLELTAAVLAALSDRGLEDRWRACAPAFTDAGAALDSLKR